MRVCGQDTLKYRTPFFNCHRLPAKMFRLLWTATVTILAALLCDGAFIPKDLACPQGGFITRETFCEDSPGCPSGEDSDTIHPRGPCILVADNPSDVYSFSCDGNGEVVPLEAMCNGSVECANGDDETHAFCPKRLRRPRGDPCEPSCVRGTCVDGTCDCPDSYFGETCQLNTFPNVSLRLAGGSSNPNPTRGRVEVFYNGQWGTVCRTSWDINDARVVCRQLGFPGALAAIRDKRYTPGDGPIVLDSVHCTGEEEGIQYCLHGGWMKKKCWLISHVGVVCEDVESMPEVSVRLAGGSDDPNPTSGRVEVSYNGEWGTVCGVNWDLNDAGVVCRQLGFAAAISTKGFGPGSGPILLDYVDCSGEEEGIQYCRHNGWKQSECDHSEDAGVECTDVPLNESVRLVGDSGGSTPSRGHVEVLHKGEWGHVCGNGWNIEMAIVVCKQLGFPTAEGAFKVENNARDTSSIFLHSYGCTGDEVAIHYCRHWGWKKHKCQLSSGIAGANCTETSLDGTLRLVPIDDNPKRGRVELFNNGEWGTVCAYATNFVFAKVVCRQLGFPITLDLFKAGISNPGTGPILLSGVRCDGNEDYIQHCGHDGWDNVQCQHVDDAGVECADTFPNASLRLAGESSDSNPNKGRVEILNNGVWGTVCQHGLDIKGARVVCRQLGFPGVLTVLNTYNPGTGPTLLRKIECSGEEEGIQYCRYSGWRSSSGCSGSQVGVECVDPSMEVPMRLAGVSDEVVGVSGDPNPTRGRVEVNINGEWGTVCDDNWDINDARVVCRQLGFATALAAIWDGSYGPGTGPILFDEIQCTGEEEGIQYCLHGGLKKHDCKHSEDAGVDCAGWCIPSCTNGGNCTIHSTCQCGDGWSGDHCQTPVCTPDCVNGGTCTSPNMCQCGDGWSGDHCQTFTCNPPCTDLEVCTGPNMCELRNGAGGDPHFLVNLPDNSNLCFSLQGEPGFTFNLVTSEIIVINAVFVDAPPRLKDWTTVIGEIGVLYYPKAHSQSAPVLKIHFNYKDKSIYVSGYGVLDAKRVSSVVLEGDKLNILSGNVTYNWASSVFVSIGDELKFKVFFNHDNLDIVWSDVSSFNHSSHGILGQFFNKGTRIDQEKRQLVLASRSPIPVILEDPKPEVHHKSPCWRPQTPGYQGEGLIEGDYTEYVVDSVFAGDFKYSLTQLEQS